MVLNNRLVKLTKDIRKRGKELTKWNELMQLKWSRVSR